LVPSTIIVPFDGSLTVKLVLSPSISVISKVIIPSESSSITRLSTISIVGSSEGVNVDLQTNEVSGGDAEGDSITGFESVKGSEYSDNLSGTEGTNYMRGEGGDDYIDARGGSDVIYGGSGDDTILPGAGNDYVHGGDDYDTVILTGNYADYTITRYSTTDIKVVDNRDGSPDGQNRLVKVEKVVFNDGYYDVINDVFHEN